MEILAGGGIVNSITLAVVLALVVALMLPKKLHYMLNGAILLALGIMHLLFEFYVIEFDIRNTPILVFVIFFVLTVTSKELISESLKEKGIAMKGITFFMGIVLIVLVLVPELYHYGAIGFNLPDYPFIVNALLYIIAGIVAMVAPFFAKGVK